MILLMTKPFIISILQDNLLFEDHTEILVLREERLLSIVTVALGDIDDERFPVKILPRSIDRLHIWQDT